jgi:hypothetical protein
MEALEKPDCAAVRADVKASVESALAEPGLVVIHLLTHGLNGKQGALYLLGPDGEQIGTSVGEWLLTAEQRDGACGPVLFILDVCYAGTAVNAQLQKLQ